MTEVHVNVSSQVRIEDVDIGTWRGAGGAAGGEGARRAQLPLYLSLPCVLLYLSYRYGYGLCLITAAAWWHLIVRVHTTGIVIRLKDIYVYSRIMRNAPFLRQFFGRDPGLCQSKQHQGLRAGFRRVERGKRGDFPPRCTTNSILPYC